MKAYYYSPAECGMSKFPEGLLRLDGIEITKHAEEADVFVVPPVMNEIGYTRIHQLPYLKGNEETIQLQFHGLGLLKI